MFFFFLRNGEGVTFVLGVYNSRIVKLYRMSQAVLMNSRISPLKCEANGSLAGGGGITDRNIP